MNHENIQRIEVDFSSGGKWIQLKSFSNLRFADTLLYMYIIFYILIILRGLDKCAFINLYSFFSHRRGCTLQPSAQHCRLLLLNCRCYIFLLFLFRFNLTSSLLKGFFLSNVLLSVGDYKLFKSVVEGWVIGSGWALMRGSWVVV